MKGTPKARITLNRLNKTVRYKSLDEKLNVDLIFQKKNKCFVLVEERINCSGYTSDELEHKKQRVLQYITKQYNKVLL